MIYNPDVGQIVNDADSLLSAMGVINPTAAERLAAVQNVILLNQPKWLVDYNKQIAPSE